MPRRLRRYVDGGVRSAASLDLLHDQGLDEVFVLAPMASRHTDRPVRPSWRAERAVDRSGTRRSPCSPRSPPTPGSAPGSGKR